MRVVAWRIVGCAAAGAGALRASMDRSDSLRRFRGAADGCVRQPVIFTRRDFILRACAHHPFYFRALSQPSAPLMQTPLFQNALRGDAHNRGQY